MIRLKQLLNIGYFNHTKLTSKQSLTFLLGISLLLSPFLNSEVWADPIDNSICGFIVTDNIYFGDLIRGEIGTEVDVALTSIGNTIGTIELSATDWEGTDTQVHLQSEVTKYRLIVDGTSLSDIPYDDKNEIGLHDENIPLILDTVDIPYFEFIQSKNMLGDIPTPEDIFFRSDGIKMLALGIDDPATVYEYDLSTAWDVSTASITNFFSIEDDVPNPTGFFFDVSGNYMYVVDLDSDDIHTFELDGPWDITYIGWAGSTSVSNTPTTLTDIFFKSDGKTAYVLEETPARVTEYSLSLAWHIPSASDTGIYFDIDTQIISPTAITFSLDGTQMYVAGDSLTSVYVYKLSVPWDITSITLVEPFDIESGENSLVGIFLREDNLKLYTLGQTTGNIDEYGVDPTALIHNQSFSIAGKDPVGLRFTSDGLRMYISDAELEAITQFDLGTAWDVSTAVEGSFFDVDAAVGGIVDHRDVFLSTDGTKLYVVDGDQNRFYEFDLSIAWDVSSAVYNGKFKDGVVSEPNPSGISFSSDGTRMYISGLDTEGIYQYNLSTAWDITSAVNSIFKDVSTQDVDPFGISFTPDGKTIHMGGGNTDTIYEYDLSTAWDLSTAILTQTFDVSPYETDIRGAFFTPDFTKMFLVGSGTDNVDEFEIDYTFVHNQTLAMGDVQVGVDFAPDGLRMYISDTNTKQVVQYDLSTAWDVSTAVEDSFFDVDDALGISPLNIRNIFLSTDGTKLYVASWRDEPAIFEFDLSTAWDVSTAVYNGKFKDLTSEDLLTGAVNFTSDGTIMFVIAATNDRIYQYDLSTAWDVSSAVYTGKFKNVGSQESSPNDFAFTSDGKTIYLVGNASDAIYEYDLSTAWDVRTAVYNGFSFGVSSYISVPYGLAFDPDFTKMFMVGSGTNDDVEEFDVEAILTHKQTFLTGKDTVGLYFSLDGMSMYVTDRHLEEVIQYDLSTAWDVSTAVEGSFFDVDDALGILTQIRDVFLSTDGTKLYIVDGDQNRFYEFDLSIAWDVSSAVYNGKFKDGVVSEPNPSGISFSSDGTRMYISGLDTEGIYQYNLSTAWDITSAVNSIFKDVSTQDVDPTGLTFTPDGKTMYVGGDNTDTIYEYDLSVAWDVSTAVYNGFSFDVSTFHTDIRAIDLNSDSTKLFATGEFADTVTEFDLVARITSSDPSDLKLELQISGIDTLEFLPYSGIMTQELTLTITCD